MKASKKQSLTNVIVVISALLVLVASAFVVLLFSGATDRLMKSNDGTYRNVSFTDATLRCEQASRDEFGKKLHQLVVDNHSSRADHSAGVFKIFLQAYVQTKAHESVEHYISCYVKASSGRISKLDVYENRDLPKAEVITRGSDKFIQWPK